jgi:hypothetical protein
MKWKIKAMFETTNQILYIIPHILPDGISETMSEFNSGSGWGSHSKKVIRNGKTMGK